MFNIVSGSTITVTQERGASKFGLWVPLSWREQQREETEVVEHREESKLKRDEEKSKVRLS